MATEKISSYAIESAYATAHMSAGNVKKRDAVNAANEAKAKGAVSDIAATVSDIVAMLKMAMENADESDEFSMCGVAVRLVKGADGKISALVGEASSPTRVSTGFDSAMFASILAGRAVNGRGVLGVKTLQNVLDMAYNADIERGITPLDRTSVTRILSSLIIESSSPRTSSHRSRRTPSESP